jgi:DNA-binding GntR family transcriptional regulator
MAEGATNLRERVVKQVRSEIVSGRIAPGTIYSVPGLATELGMSTTPVREALLELSRAGFLSPMRNRGFRVEQTSLQDLENIFDLRVLLESYALVEVAKKRPTDTAPLVALADAVAEAVKRNDVPGYIETDRRFHEALVSRAENALLTKMVMGLRSDMRLYGIDSPEGRKRQRASVGEHYQMVELATAGDTEGIAALIKKHILEWKPLFRAALAAAPTAKVAPATAMR